MSFNLGSIKSMIFIEPEAKVTPADPRPAEAPRPIQQTPSFTPSFSVPQQVAIEASGDNKAYERLKSAINFDNTTVGKLIAKYLDPMKGVAIDDQTKYKIAIAQLKINDGVDTMAVMGAFDGLQTQLRNERVKFDAYVEQKNQTIVQPLADKVAEINNKLKTLQEDIRTASDELTATNTQLIEAQGKVSKGKADFAAAEQIMSQDIEREKARYASLLQVI